MSASQVDDRRRRGSEKKPEREPFSWRALAEAYEAKLRPACEGDEAWQGTLGDHLQGLACLVFGQAGLVFATSAFKARCGAEHEPAWGSKPSEVPLLRLKPPWLHEALNAEPMQRLDRLHRGMLHRTLTGERNGISHFSGETDFDPAQAVHEVLISPDAEEHPYWNLLCAFGTEKVSDEGPNAGPHVVYVVTRLQAAVPELLCRCWEEEKRTAIGKAVLQKYLVDLRGAVSDWEASAGGPARARVAEEGCRHLCGVFDKDAASGDQVVLRTEPADLKKSLWAMKLLEGTEREITKAWKKDDVGYRPRSKLETNAEPAWALADPGLLDCPLVVVSPGFEDLTGYWAAFSLGRNCRFLQPKIRQRNVAFNGPELARLAEFCRKKEGQTMSLLLSERATGARFWQLLYLKHFCGDDPMGPPGLKKDFIFSLHTHLYSQEPVLNEMLPWESTDSGLVKALRTALSEKLATFDYAKQSLRSLTDEVVVQWMLDVAPSVPCCNLENVCAPRAGMASVREFEQAGVVPELVSACAKDLMRFHKVGEDVIRRTASNEDGGLVCAISDPLAKDCPLVFVSRAFEAMTGYDADFALGRNCRFLQPGYGRLNVVVNGREAGEPKRLRSFCESGAPGDSMVSLMLNERMSGNRFWSLFRMVKASVRGRPYVLAVLTPLSINMPGVLLSREQSRYYIDEMGRVTEEWGTFMTKLRELLRGREANGADGEGMSTFARDQILTFMRTCEDYEFDLFVPKIGMKEVRAFKEMWPEVCSTIQPEAERILELPDWDGVGLPMAVSDPEGIDCPLVYLNREFEEVTGYYSEWALGRNWKFIQPKDEKLNILFNSSEHPRLKRFFASSKSEEGLPQTRMLSLIIAATKDRAPFWCLLWSERVVVGGRPFFVSFIHHLQAGGRLVELLAGDDAGLEQLEKLRELFRKREDCLTFQSLKTVASLSIDEWLAQYPPILELPRVECEGMATPFPLAGLELCSGNARMSSLVDALECGVRHFQITFPSYTEVKDHERNAYEGRLLALKIAEMMRRLRYQHLAYLRSGLCFSMRTPPHLVCAFTDIRKALTSNNVSLHCWLLDARGAKDAEVAACWERMSRAKSAGEVKVVGLFGGGAGALSAAQGVRGGATVSIFAQESYLGRRQEDGDSRMLAKFRKAGGTVMLHNVYGPQQSLLTTPAIENEAEQLGISPVTLLLKWVEHQGCCAVVPSFNTSTAQTADAVSKRKAGDLPNVHRTFVREYRAAPSAKDCFDTLMRDGALVGRRVKISILDYAGLPPVQTPREPAKTAGSSEETSVEEESASTGSEPYLPEQLLTTSRDLFLPGTLSSGFSREESSRRAPNPWKQSRAPLCQPPMQRPALPRRADSYPSWEPKVKIGGVSSVLGRARLPMGSCDSYISEKMAHNPEILLSPPRKDVPLLDVSPLPDSSFSPRLQSVQEVPAPARPRSETPCTTPRQYERRATWTPSQPADTWTPRQPWTPRSESYRRTRYTSPDISPKSAREAVRNRPPNVCHIDVPSRPSARSPWSSQLSQAYKGAPQLPPMLPQSWRKV